MSAKDQSESDSGLDRLIGRPVLEVLDDGVYVLDRNRRIAYWNRAAEQLTGYIRSEVVGRACYENLLGHTDGAGTQLCHGICPMALSMIDGRSRVAEIFMRHKDGHRVPVVARVSPLCDETGDIVGAVEVFFAQRERIGRNDFLNVPESTDPFDPMIGLPNRVQLCSRLHCRLAELGRYGWGFGVLLVETRPMTSAGMNLNPESRDSALRSVARALISGLRLSDTVGCWDAGQFLVVLNNAEASSLPALGQRFQRRIEELKVPGGPAGTSDTQTSIVIGAAFAHPSDTIDLLLQRARESLSEARQTGVVRVEELLVPHPGPGDRRTERTSDGSDGEFLPRRER